MVMIAHEEAIDGIIKSSYDALYEYRKLNLKSYIHVVQHQEANT